jgi:hypothetical protein
MGVLAVRVSDIAFPYRGLKPTVPPAPAETVLASWDAAELCRIGRFDRMVRNVFLPEFGQ